MSKIRPNDFKDNPKVKINGEWMEPGGNQYEFTRCHYIWFNFLLELNGNPKAVNPLECIYQSFWPEVCELLKEAKYIGQTQEFYLSQSDKYCDQLGRGEIKPYSDKTRQVGWKDPATGEFNWRKAEA